MHLIEEEEEKEGKKRRRMEYLSSLDRENQMKKRKENERKQLKATLLKRLKQHRLKHTTASYSVQPFLSLFHTHTNPLIFYLSVINARKFTLSQA